MSSEIQVLHVDTDTDFTEATARMLADDDEGFRVETVTTASEGLDFLSEHDVDCVLSAYDLPERTGIEFLQAVRGTYSDLPFLLLTDEGSEEIASDAIAAGVTGYLQKRTDAEQSTVLSNRIVNTVEKYWMERELDGMRRKYRKLVEQNFVGIYIIQDGEFTYVNPKLADIHGYEQERIIGMSPLELVAPEERDRVKENLQRRLGGEVDDIQYQTVGLTSEGERIDIELHGSRIFYEGAPAVIGAELDISERKERERELHRQNERLDKFARVVSHDLQNPLQVATARLEFAQAECDSEHLDEIADAHDRMETLITDLLALAQEGERITDTEPVELDTVVDACWQSVQTGDATLVTDTTRTILADPSRVRQLLENLVRNAVEQRDDGVTITVGDLERGFYVADDGPGIPAAERDQIFEAGFSTTEDGTGFGLNIVEEIAAAHGWDVRVTDSETGGARFEITGVELADG